MGMVRLFSLLLLFGQNCILMFLPVVFTVGLCVICFCFFFLHRDFHPHLCADRRHDWTVNYFLHSRVFG